MWINYTGQISSQTPSMETYVSKHFLGSILRTPLYVCASKNTCLLPIGMPDPSPLALAYIVFPPPPPILKRICRWNPDLYNHACMHGIQLQPTKKVNDGYLNVLSISPKLILRLWTFSFKEYQFNVCMHTVGSKLFIHVASYIPPWRNVWQWA